MVLQSPLRMIGPLKGKGGEGKHEWHECWVSLSIPDWLYNTLIQSIQKLRKKDRKWSFIE